MFFDSISIPALKCLQIVLTCKIFNYDGVSTTHILMPRLMFLLHFRQYFAPIHHQIIKPFQFSTDNSYMLEPAR